MANSWLLIESHNQAVKDWPMWLLAVLSIFLVWKTKIHLQWLLGWALLAWFEIH